MTLAVLGGRPESEQPRVPKAPIREPGNLRIVAGVALGAMLVGGVVSLWLGQDQNFDLLNYHYYLGYALLHGRIDRDIAPAGTQTYMFPVLHLLHYLGLAHLPPRLCGFLLGALHALNVPLLFVLSLSLLRGLEPGLAQSLALTAAVLGGIGPNAVSMLGTTFGDNVVTIPALLALVLVLAPDQVSQRHPLLAPFAAGALSGFATALKLTMGIFQLALFLPVALMPGTPRRRLQRLVLLAAGGLLGFLSIGGHWSWSLYQRFGSPVFPLANELFKSDWYSRTNFQHPVYTNKGLGDVVYPVLDTAMGRETRLQEIPLRDLRLVMLVAAATAWLAIRLSRALQESPKAGEGLGWWGTAFALYWLAGYLLWATFFPYYRYLTLLELTAPLLTLVLLRPVLAPRWLAAVALALALVLALTTRTGSWGRRQWSDTWLQMPVPPLGLRPDSMVLLVGQPIAYVVPSFPQDARFVHLTAVDRFGAPARWREKIARAIASHQGPLLLLSNFEFAWTTAAARAAEFGLHVTPRCEPIRNGSLRLRMCELERSGPAGGAPAAP